MFQPPIKSLAPDIPSFYGRNSDIRYSMHPASYWGKTGIKLGSGSYGTVWRFKSPEGKYVAIKVFGKAEEGDASTDSIREISILRRCNHPNIIKMIDIGGYDSSRRDSSIFVVLELAQMDLARLINSTSRLYTMKFGDHTLLRSYMYQLARGIHYLHSNDIVHLDIKPANILIFDNGARLVIADFGFSRAGIIPGDTETLAQTLWWRAPELLLGSSGQLKSLDIFSLGVVYLDMLFDEYAFKVIEEEDDKEDHVNESILLKQVELLGHMTEEDWPGVSGFVKYTPTIKAYALDHLEGNLKERLKTNAKFYFEMGPGLETFLMKLLSPNPSRRSTIDSIVTDRYFTEYYDVKSVVEQKMPVNVNVKPTDPYCGEYMDPALYVNKTEDLIPSIIPPQFSIRLFDMFTDIKVKTRMSTAAVFHARYLFEYAVSMKPDMPKDDWQLLGTTCLYISRKLIDGRANVYPSYWDLMPYNAEHVGPMAFIKMELEILKLVNFDLLFPTPMQYFHYILIDSTDQIRFIARNVAWLLSVIKSPNMDARKISYVSTYIAYKCTNEEFPKCMNSGNYDYATEADLAIDQINYLRFERRDLEATNKITATPQISKILDNWPACRQLKITTTDSNQARLTFLWYDEEADEELVIPLSSEVIDCIKNNGWRLDEKVGQGSENAVFSATALDGSNIRVAILIGNSCTDKLAYYLDKIRKLQELGVFSTEYMVKVYPSIQCDVKISSYHRYCPGVANQSKHFGIVELVGKTLAECVYMNRTNTTYNKYDFIVKTYNQVLRLFSYLADKKFEYPDLLLDNFAYRDTTLIFIDLNGLRSASRETSPETPALEIVDSMMNVFDESEFNAFIRNNSWKGVTGMATNAHESRTLREMFSRQKV